MPKISVLVPVFNRRQFISECIQSVLDQTITDFELIIIDNASNDGTWEVCERFSAIDARLHIFRNTTNIGPLKNIVLGLEKCRGEYIKILFSDDLMRKNCLERMVATLEENPDGAMVITNVSTLRNQELIDHPIYSFKNERIASTDYIKKVIFEDAMPLSPGACLFRSKDIRNNYKDELRSPVDRRVEEHGAGPDLLSMLLTSACHEYVCLIGESLNIFREHKESLSISKSGKNLSDCYVQAKINFAHDYFSQRELCDILARIYINRCLGYKAAMTPSKFRDVFGIKLNIIEAFRFNICAVIIVVRKIVDRVISRCK